MYLIKAPVVMYMFRILFGQCFKIACEGNTKYFNFKVNQNRKYFSMQFLYILDCLDWLRFETFRFLRRFGLV